MGDNIKDNPETAHLMEQIDFANLLGVSQTMVSKAVLQGRISSVKIGKRRYIDPERAKKEWHEYQAVRADQEASTEEQTSYQANRARREMLKAQTEELNLKKRQGELWDAKEVEEASLQAARLARDSLMAIPSRVASLIAAETDDKKVYDMLEAEIEKTLEGLSEAYRNQSDI